MKKIFLFLAVASTAFFASCSSDDDVTVRVPVNEVFERTVSFTAPSYSVLIPLTPPIGYDDVVLTYRLTEVVGGNDVWRLVPQTFFFPEGEFEYISDFTQNDISVYIDADFDPGIIPAYTQNQTFRFVIIPGNFAQTLDVNNYDAVMSTVQEYNNGGVPSIDK
jgi:hypothetical protein